MTWCRPGGPNTVSGRSRSRRSKVLSSPGSPSQWSAWKWVRKTSSRSARPTERRSWRWVPSPQSNSSRPPPRRTSTAGMPRRAVGTEPAVPAKKIERSVTRRTLEERHEREGDGAAGRRGRAHGVVGLAAAVGRAPRVEDLKAVRGVPLVQRDVGVAEDHGGAVGEAPAQPVQAPLRRAGVVDEGDAGAAGLHGQGPGQRGSGLRVVDVAVDGADLAVRLELAQDRQRAQVAGVEDEVGGT